VETLGSCDYICSDKTGTITENRMTVTGIYAAGRVYTVTGVGYAPEGDILLDGKKVARDEELRKVLLVGLLCSTANHYLDEEDRAWKIDGTPTEGALIVAAKKYGLDPEDEESRHELIDEIAFSSARKYMAMLFRQGERLILMVKGAPEKLLLFAGKGDDQALKDVYTRMAADGLRVLGFGVKELSGPAEDIDLEREATQGLTFLGFQGIIDPPKQSAIAAIRGAEQAGIRVMMITGDNKITAGAIARQVGILQPGELVVTGQELDEKGKAFLSETVEKTAAYARVSPLHKLEIVEALQTKGHIVAVTGDGVNDAPALKKGNIGVAMGRAGTDVAREAADMILKDDNFASIFEAVKVGRIIFDNIRKVTYFLLSSSTGIAFSIIAALLLGLPLPYLATQVLWINLVTNGMQDIALAYEPAEEEIGQRPPRSPDENIVNGEIFARMMIAGVVLMIGTLALFWYELRSGASLRYAQTTAFNTIVFFQFFQVWNSRSLHRSILNVHFFSNPFLLVSLLLSVLAQIAVLTWAPFHYIFNTVRLSPATWLQSLAVSFTIVIAVEIDKAILRKRNRQ
jgi:Ca2+-transporting ATPase